MDHVLGPEYVSQVHLLRAFHLGYRSYSTQSYSDGQRVRHNGEVTNLVTFIGAPIDSKSSMFTELCPTGPVRATPTAPLEWKAPDSYRVNGRPVIKGVADAVRPI